MCKWCAQVPVCATQTLVWGHVISAKKKYKKRIIAHSIIFLVKKNVHHLAQKFSVELVGFKFKCLLCCHEFPIFRILVVQFLFPIGLWKRLNLIGPFQIFCFEIDILLEKIRISKSEWSHWRLNSHLAWVESHLASNSLSLLVRVEADLLTQNCLSCIAWLKFPKFQKFGQTTRFKPIR